MTEYKKVKATMVEKRGKCEMHSVGDTIVFDFNFIPDKKMCYGIYFPMQPFLMACSLGGKSWEKDDPEKFYISCISKKGTVWKIERID